MGNTVFTNVMEVGEVVLIRVALNPMTDVLIEEKAGMVTQREGLVKTEAETGGPRPQAKGHLEPPEAGRGKRDLPWSF